MSTYFQIVTRDRETLEKATYSLQNNASILLKDTVGHTYFGTVHVIQDMNGDLNDMYQIRGRVARQDPDDGAFGYTPERDSAESRYYTFTTQDLSIVEHAKLLLLEGKAGFITESSNIYGFVTEIRPRAMIDGDSWFEVKIRPVRPMGTRMSGEVTFPINFLEDKMKVYEAIVLTVDDKGEVTGIAKVVAPFTAKDANEAKNIVRVDYAAENNLTGKDAAALQVRVREFPLA